MRAVTCPETTGPGALRVVDDHPEPTGGDGMVLVDVHASGISFPDLLLTRGEYQLKPDPPFVPGVEVAGTVVEAPADSGLAAGDRVCAASLLSGWAERAAVPAMLTFKLHDRLSFEQGAGLIMNWHTALFALERRAHLQPGETVLVQGAGGGVGTAAIQVARGLGAGTVIAVARPGQKADLAMEAGADQVLDPDGEWAAQVKKQVDVVVDPVGGDRFTDSLRSLKPDGRLVVIGFADEQKIPTVKVNRLLFGNSSIVGAAWGEYLRTDPGMPAEHAVALDRMVEEGHVAPLVGRAYAMEEAGQALEDLQGRRAAGKLVLQVR